MSDVQSGPSGSPNAPDNETSAGFDLEEVPSVTNAESEPQSSTTNNPVLKPRGAVPEHINQQDHDDKCLLPCKYCMETWYFPKGAFNKTASSTTNQLKQVENHHAEQCAGQMQPGSNIIGRMDGYLRNSPALEKQIAASSSISDKLIREAIENFILSETEPFSVIE